MPWVCAPRISRGYGSTSWYAAACSASSPTCGPLPWARTRLHSSTSGASALAAILIFARCASAVIGSVRLSKALPPSATTIVFFFTTTDSSIAGHVQHVSAEAAANATGVCSRTLRVYEGPLPGVEERAPNRCTRWAGRLPLGGTRSRDRGRVFVLEKLSDAGDAAHD